MLTGASSLEVVDTTFLASLADSVDEEVSLGTFLTNSITVDPIIGYAVRIPDYASTLRKKISIFTFKAAITCILRAVWYGANVVIELEGITTLVAAVRAVSNATQDLALAVDSELKRLRALST